MSTYNKRIEKIEEATGADSEPQFAEWIDDPWTEEQKEKMLRKYPEVKIFIKPLSKTLPHDLNHQSKAELQFAKDMASCTRRPGKEMG